MDELLCSIIIVLIITMILCTIILACKPGSLIHEYMTLKPEQVCSSLDNRCYKISGAYDKGKTLAADTLARLNSDILRVIRHMRDKYLWNKNLINATHPSIILRKKLVDNMLHRYNADVLVENVPWSINETSYTKEKGSMMAICLREKQTGEHKIDEYDNILFVGLHELTHVSTNVKDHNPPFWHIFKVLLREAKDAGVYKPINYEQNPMNACGLPVAYNPFYDASLYEEAIYAVLDSV